MAMESTPVWGVILKQQIPQVLLQAHVASTTGHKEHGPASRPIERHGFAPAPGEASVLPSLEPHENCLNHCQASQCQIDGNPRRVHRAIRDSPQVDKIKPFIRRGLKLRENT